jgi:hypothetical protein
MTVAGSMTSTDGTEGALTGTHQQGGGSAGEGEHLLGALGALLTECERLRTMGEVAAGRLRRLIGDLEGRIDGGEDTACERPRPPSSSLQKIRLEKTMTKGAPQPVVRHGLVVGSVVAFAALWTLGIVVDLPQRPVAMPLQSPHETREVRELNRAPAGQAAMIQERLPLATGKTMTTTAPPARPATLPPSVALPALSTGFVGRALASPGGHARASEEAMRRVETDLELQSSAARPGLIRPTDTLSRRGPSPETP